MVEINIKQRHHFHFALTSWATKVLRDQKLTNSLKYTSNVKTEIRSVDVVKIIRWLVRITNGNKWNASPSITHSMLSDSVPVVEIII